MITVLFLVLFIGSLYQVVYSFVGPCKISLITKTNPQAEVKFFSIPDEQSSYLPKNVIVFCGLFLHLLSFFGWVKT